MNNFGNVHLTFFSCSRRQGFINRIDELNGDRIRKSIIVDIHRPAAMSGICVSFASISLYGLLSLRRIVFVISFPVLAIFLIASIFAAPIKGLMQEVMASLQLLLVIHATEIGSSSIYFDRILGRMREPVEGTTVSSVARTLRRSVVNLTGIITASFIVSSLFLGSVTNYKLEPLFLVAIATAIVLLSLIFLGTNLPSTTTQTEKS